MIRGFVDSLRVNALNEARVVGWVCDTIDPAHRLKVRGRIGVRVIGDAIADRSRPDLSSNQIGDGHSGFVLMLDAQLTEEEKDTLIVEAKRGDALEWLTLPERRVDGRRTVAQHFQEEAAAEIWSDAESSNAGANLTSAEARPVFIVGAARSGTSAIFQSLTLVTRYRGFFEGHVLDIAAALESTVRQHFHIKSRQVPNPSFYHLEAVSEARALEGVKDALRRLTAGYQTPFWADKTPTPAMARSVPMLAATWPSARFIFMKRRGIENVMSRMRKFRRTGFEYSASDWAATMSAWRAVRHEIPGRFLEIEQMDLLRRPFDCARAIAGLLALTDREEKDFAAHLSQNRPEVTDPTARIFSSLEQTGWDAECIATFQHLCHHEMLAFGYTYDDRYSVELADGLANPPAETPDTSKASGVFKS